MVRFNMRSSGLMRAVTLSSAAYAHAFMIASIAISIWNGNTPPLGAMFVYALVSTVVVALAGCVQWPILRAIASLRCGIVVTVGAMLAVLPLAILIMLFKDGDDPTNVGGFIRFWFRVPGEFLLGFVPMALAGGLLGWYASARSVTIAGSPNTQL